MRGWCWVLVALMHALASTGLASNIEGLAFVRASTQHKEGAEPAKYHPINLIDNNPDTIWCEDGGRYGEGEAIEFHFFSPQSIDRIVVVPTSMSGSRVTGVTLTDKTAYVSVPVASDGSRRQLKRPVEGAVLTVRIDQVGEPTETPGAMEVTCLADVLLYEQNVLFGGNVNPGKVRYDANLDRILGLWKGGPLEAPSKMILFGLGGKWRWQEAPAMGIPGRQLAGTYRFRGNRLLMRKGKRGRWADMGSKFKRVSIDAEDPKSPLDDYQILVLNRALGPLLRGRYNDARFR